MHKYGIKMSLSAQNDLEQAVGYIALTLHEPETAKRLYQNIKAAILTLAELPERFSLLEETPYAARGVRRLLVGNYVVFYVVREDRKQVDVLRILYYRREWEPLLHLDEIEE